MTVTPLSPPPDTQAFRDAMAALAATVCVVTAGSGTARTGRTVTAAFSLSVDPPAILVSIKQGSLLDEAIRAENGFSFSMLSAWQSEIGEAFAGRHPSLDRFADPAWGTWPSGRPRLDGAVATMDCRVAQEVDVFGHTLFVGKVTAIELEPSRRPLVWHNRDFTTL